jgi:hypothetical protein
MRIGLLSFVLFVVVSTKVQQINPSQVNGTAVVQTPVGAQTITQPSGTTLGVNSLNGVVNAALFAGSDLGAQIIAAIAASTSTHTTVHIPGNQSPYTWSTPVTIDPRYVSIIGDGSANTIINCSASVCLTVHESVFNLDDGGIIQGFSLFGNGSSGQIGIESSGVQNQRWDDLAFFSFTGTGAISWWLYNNNVSEGWQERNQATKIRIEDGNGLQFDYLSSNASAGSFGYSKFEVSCDNEIVCFNVNLGRLYGSDITIQGNIASTGTLIQALGDMDSDRFFIEAEPLSTTVFGTCIHVLPGGEMSGVGVVECRNSALIDANYPQHAPSLRIVPGDSTKSAALSGTFTNWQGTGNTVQANIIGVGGLSDPFPQFGTLLGPFTYGTYTSMQNAANSGHYFFSCPIGFADLSDCAQVGKVDALGNALFTSVSASAGASISEVGGWGDLAGNGLDFAWTEEVRRYS